MNNIHVMDFEIFEGIHLNLSVYMDGSFNLNKHLEQVGRRLANPNLTKDAFFKLDTVKLQEMLTSWFKDNIAFVYGNGTSTQVLANKIMPKTNLSPNALVLKETKRIKVIKHSDILYIRGAGNYVEIGLSSGRNILHRDSLKSIEQNIPYPEFCRIHKSTIIKTSLVTELRPLGNGDFAVKLENDITFTISRNFREHFPLL